jgi:hypothetical protein
MNMLGRGYANGGTLPHKGALPCVHKLFELLRSPFTPPQPSPCKGATLDTQVG